MIRLNVEDYCKVMEPLEQVPINTLFAQTVLSGMVKGTVYVDDPNRPEAFYIAHSNGMSLLFGNTENSAFLEGLRNYLLNAGQIRKTSEWLQVYPDNWNTFVRSLSEPGQRNNDTAPRNTSDVSQPPITENSRINFTFDRQKYEAAASQSSAESFQIIHTTKEIFLKLDGRVSPNLFWVDAEQFLAEGYGFSLLENGETVSTAFSAYRIGNQLEIGIETSESARGKGYAFHVSLALIAYCLEHGLEPVWACRRENAASYCLAQKLGFVPSISLPYYRLQVFLPTE
ncbi:GNAT acetyltransferase-like protein [Fontibacillus phaseoli]|uniref:GNAT acetyltransferase-like protein n=1 Tax=Fontibacillus phaseoli TaxID=1416533 RepID=A0A369BCP5_9BACL|nr:GNAT family N-acetyltransferase [Fontibacillus phaseoli]RCX18217.1 GNAT acetyltransferase-like protein [Fontibacillus phaseoli]